MSARPAEVEAAQKAMGCDPYWNTHRLPPRCECIITAHAERRWDGGCPIAMEVAVAVVAAAQPRLAARALREAAEEHLLHFEFIGAGSRAWLHSRADEIEAKP